MDVRRPTRRSRRAASSAEGPGNCRKRIGPSPTRHFGDRPPLRLLPEAAPARSLRRSASDFLVVACLFVLVVLMDAACLLCATIAFLAWSRRRMPPRGRRQPSRQTQGGVRHFAALTAGRRARHSLLAWPGPY